MIKRNNTPALANDKSVTELDLKSYVVGFVDGEGSFSVSFNKRAKLSTKIEVRPSFSISQNKRNLNVLKKIHTFFTCGAIRFSKSDQCYKYEVRNLNDLVTYIIPHFDSYSLQTTKRDDFKIFKSICNKMKRSLHLNANYLEGIICDAYKMNPSGKRKYELNYLLKQIAR